jgi:hypothetical protein
MKVREEYIAGLLIGAFCGALYLDAGVLKAIWTALVIVFIYSLILLIDFLWNLIKHAFKSYMHREEV